MNELKRLSVYSTSYGKPRPLAQVVVVDAVYSTSYGKPDNDLSC